MKNDDSKNDIEQLDRLFRAVLKSSKYKNVCEDLIKNIGEKELSKRKNFDEALKSTKNKLHQIGGAYFVKRPDYGNWIEALRSARKTGDKDLFREKCLEIMSFHHSTKERLNTLDQFYSRIFSMLPKVNSIIDIACGFNPLSIPMMPVSENIRYYACDVYRDLIDFINEYFSILSIEGLAETRDVTQIPPKTHADLALVLYAIPCLEQIDRLAGRKILESVDADFVVVSFPLRSLGAREKGMRKHYEARFNTLLKGKDWGTQRLDFDTEMVFIIQKDRAS